MKGDLPANWAEIVQAAHRRGRGGHRFAGHARLLAGWRSTCSARRCREMLGGSADLTGSVNTKRKDSVDLTTENFHGNYVYYGVREFGMTAIMNGLTVHGGYPSVRRHVPGVLRLRAQRGARRGDHALPDHAGVHARLHRPRRRRPDASAHRASRRRCAPCRTCTSGAPAMRWSRRCRGWRRSSARTARRRWSSRARACRSRRARPSSWSRCARAATCSSTATVRRRPS